MNYSWKMYSNPKRDMFIDKRPCGKTIENDGVRRTWESRQSWLPQQVQLESMRTYGLFGRFRKSRHLTLLTSQVVQTNVRKKKKVLVTRKDELQVKFSIKYIKQTKTKTNKTLSYTQTKNDTIEPTLTFNCHQLKIYRSSLMF